MNRGQSPQKVFLGPWTRRGLSGEFWGNLWVCFISESEAVEKLLQTPWPGWWVELGSDSCRTLGSNWNCRYLSSQLCVIFTLNKYSLTPGISVSSHQACPLPSSLKQLKTKLIKKSPPAHQQLVLCPLKGFEVSLRRFHYLFVFLFTAEMPIRETMSHLELDNWVEIYPLESHCLKIKYSIE